MKTTPLLLLLTLLGAVPLAYAADPPAASASDGAPRLRFDPSRSVYVRTIDPPEPEESVDWGTRITQLLVEKPGDVVITAVGDMIFNQQISTLDTPHHRQLLRIMQEADLAYGNLEFSLNAHPELQRPFYNFRADPEFAWELATIGINLVSMANNHALDFGPDGLRDCLTALDRANISHAGAGMTRAAARAPATTGVQSRKTKFALLSYVRYWTQKYRCLDPSGACLSTIDPAKILIAKSDGKTEEVEGLLASDIAEMQDEIVLAKRHHDVVIVALHNHDLSHHRAYGIQDTTPPNDEVMYRKAIEAGADIVIGSGPHVVRGVEIYRGKPILYSLANFIYQYRTPDKIPVDLIHQRDGEVERPDNVSVWDLRDHPLTFEGLMARLTVNEGKLTRLELIPLSIDREGELYGVPRLPTAARGRQILDRLRKLSQPYGTKLRDRDWYVELEL